MSGPQLATHRSLSCSFCAKSQHEVAKLIAGPTTYICDECVALCNTIIDEETSVVTARVKHVETATSRSASIWPSLATEIRAAMAATVLTLLLTGRIFR